MAESDFILAVGPNGDKRLVPAHYLDNPAFGFTLPPAEEPVEEPATPAKPIIVREPAAPEKKEARS